MSIIKTISVSAIVGISFALTFTPTTTQASDVERLALSLCESAKSDDRRTMRKKLDTAKIRLTNIYSGIRCGNQGSLLRVATTSGSIDAAKYITTKIRKSDLDSIEEDGFTIIQYAQKLVSDGDTSKQVFVELFNSKS